jgi:MtN3 and saliva related transmembrane protein
MVHWYMIGSTAALLTMFGFMPQVLKMYHTKSVKDISIPMLFQLSGGVFLWMLYGIHLQDIIIIVANLVTLLTLIITIGLYFRYNKSDQYKTDYD